jgi:hypothetical protein
VDTIVTASFNSDFYKRPNIYQHSSGRRSQPQEVEVREPVQRRSVEYTRRRTPNPAVIITAFRRATLGAGPRRFQLPVTVARLNLTQSPWTIDFIELA